MICDCDECGRSEWFPSWVVARACGWVYTAWHNGWVTVLCPECDHDAPDVAWW